MAAKNVAPALEVFPTLCKWPVIQPRGGFAPRAAPIGRQQASYPSKRAIEHSIRHLYHDLGVLVFTGCSASQAARVGDILAEVTRAGGPGGLYSLYNEGRRIKVKALGKGQCYEAAPTQHNGTVIRPGALIDLAEKHLQPTVRETISPETPLRQTEAHVPAKPAREVASLVTATGLRPLSLDCFTSVRVEPEKGNVVGVASFWATGTGAFAGSARIEYAADEGLDDKKKTAESKKDKDRRVGAQITDGVLRPLWKLEREIWAHRAEALVSKADNVV